MAGGGIGQQQGQQQVPQWMQGLQLGQQIAQMGQRPQAPQGPGFQPRPMMGAGMPGGMPQNVVPGTQGMAPSMPSQGMMNVNQGMAPNGGGGMNPQILQLLQRGGLMR